jgi:hypothetical protein
MNILETLAKKNLLDGKDIDAIRREVEETGDSLERVLARYGVESGDLLSIQSEELNIPSRTVGDGRVPFDVLGYIPEESARHYRFVPLAL